MPASTPAGTPNSARPERAQLQLDTGLRPIVLDDGRRGMQTADQRLVHAGWLGRIDLLRNAERFIQREDHREKR